VVYVTKYAAVLLVVAAATSGYPIENASIARDEGIGDKVIPVQLYYWSENAVAVNTSTPLFIYESVFLGLS
jgi:hypothetical protein